MSCAGCMHEAGQGATLACERTRVAWACGMGAWHAQTTELSKADIHACNASQWRHRLLDQADIGCIHLSLHAPRCIDNPHHPRTPACMAAVANACSNARRSRWPPKMLFRLLRSCGGEWGVVTWCCHLLFLHRLLRMHAMRCTTWCVHVLERVCVAVEAPRLQVSGVVPVLPQHPTALAAACFTALAHAAPALPGSSHSTSSPRLPLSPHTLHNTQPHTPHTHTSPSHLTLTWECMSVEDHFSVSFIGTGGASLQPRIWVQWRDALDS